MHAGMASIEELAERQATDRIDRIIQTCFVNSYRGYTIKGEQLKDSAKAVIVETLNRLPEQSRKERLKEADYRLQKVARFEALGKDEKSQIAQVAKKKHISFEEAYDSS
jgi:predicted transcriptional regulator of viral defense system